MTLAALVEGGEFRAAFSQAIALWRLKPHARLAALVTELALHARKETPTELPVANEPSTLPAVLDAIFVSGNSVATLANLEAFLATKPSDPRLFDWFVARLGRPPFDITNPNPQRLYQAIVRAMARLDDERVAPWVAELPAFCEARKGRRHGQLSAEEIEALTRMFASCELAQTAPRPLTEEEEAEVAAVRVPLDALAAKADSLEEQRAALFEKVIADPSDDTAKEIFADFLLEHDDPLGEYVILGLKLAREGTLPPAQEARLATLLPHARRFQPMGMRFERGFAVEARLTDGEGIRRGQWGTELGWGTIVIADVPPISDACHTESLRELQLGATFVADLAKLSKPLAVTKLTWITPSQNGRAKWRKVKVLPELRELVLDRPMDGAFGWTILEGPGTKVRALTVDQTWRMARHIPWICELLRGEGALERVALGPHVVFERSGGALTLTLKVHDPTVQAELERELAAVTRPLVHEVTVDAPGDASAYAALLSLGRHGRVTATRSAVADAARLVREGETFRIEPGPGTVFDAFALRWLLASAKEQGWTGQRVTIGSAAEVEQAGAYCAELAAHGGSELELVADPAARQKGRPSLTIAPGPALEAVVGREDHVPMLMRAIATLSARPTRLRVRHSPYLLHLIRVRNRLEAIADNVELVADEQAFIEMFTCTNKAKRLAIDPAGASHALMPATLDQILTLSGAPKEIRIGQLDVPLVPWMEWVSRTKQTVLFAREWKSNVVRHLAWNDGVTLRIGHLSWERIAMLLADFPAQALKKLTVTNHALPPPSVEQQCRRVAGAFEALRVA